MLPHSITIEQVVEISKAIGLVIAGLWTAWTFHRLQKVRAAELTNSKTIVDIQKGHIDIEKARKEIEKIRADIEKNRFDVEKSRMEAEKGRADIEKSRIEQIEIRERIRNQQPQLFIKLEVSEEKPSHRNDICTLCVAVTLKNEGNLNLAVQFNKETLIIGRMELGNDGRQQLIGAQSFEPVYAPEGAKSMEPFGSRILRVGQSRKMTLAFLPITTPGGYFIQFSALYGKATLGLNGDNTGQSTLVINAVEQDFYIIREREEASQTAHPSRAASEEFEVEPEDVSF